MLISIALSNKAYALISIDITSSERKFPIAIPELAGPYGGEISSTITDDLEYTGLFLTLQRDAFIEDPEQSFTRENWSPLGAEAVLKGQILANAGKITVTVSLYDISDGTAILHKSYETDDNLLLPLAHSIANDIYLRITGQDGIFRTRIAFVGHEKDRRRLYLMDWDGQRIKKSGITATVMLTPHCPAHGSRLIYSAQRNGQWAIYMLDLQEMQERLVYASSGTPMAGDFFPSADSFAFSSSEKGSPDIYNYIISTKETTRLTSMRGIEVSPSIPPDGETIAFVSDRGGSPQVYTMDKNGYNITRVTFEGSYNTSPSWSPDGRRIVFAGRYEGKNQIFTVSPDGSDTKRLTETGNNEEPAFSPDGRFIAFTSDREGEKGIYTMRADGEGQKRITPKGLKASSPRWLNY